jgi:pimeloyl-ACP methyl ester carboxylesterase
MMDWTNGFIDIDGASLEYACFGAAPGDAPTLVMLHEGLGSVAQWHDLPQRLADQTGFGVLAYSRAGYGQSSAASLPRPLDYQTREAVDVLGPLLDAAGVQDCVLLGHSDGATIAAIYAGSVSDMRVRGLVLIAPHFFTEPQGLASIAATMDAYENGDLKQKLAKYHAHPDSAYYGWHDTWTHPDYAAWNVADSIDHWRIPVLAVQGTDDPYGTMAQIDEIDSRIYSPLETLVLDGVGHAPHREATDRTIAAITEFCARLKRMEEAEVELA